MTMTHGSRTEPGNSARERRAESRYSRQSSGSRDYSTMESGASTSVDARRGSAPAEHRHSTRGFVNPGVHPTHKRRLQHKSGSKQVISVRGRRVIAPRADPKLIKLFTLVVVLLCVGVGVSMGLSGMSTQQTYQLQQLKSEETALSNQIESLNRDVEDARSGSTLAGNATEMGMVSPIQPGVLAVQENGDIVEQRPADPESRPIIDINGQQIRPNRASSNPDETSEVTANLQEIPQGTATPPYQTNSNAGTVPYAATTRESGQQAGGVGQ